MSKPITAFLESDSSTHMTVVSLLTHHSPALYKYVSELFRNSKRTIEPSMDNIADDSEIIHLLTYVRDRYGYEGFNYLNRYLIDLIKVYRNRFYIFTYSQRCRTRHHGFTDTSNFHNSIRRTNTDADKKHNLELLSAFITNSLIAKYNLGSTSIASPTDYIEYLWGVVVNAVPIYEMSFFDKVNNIDKYTDLFNRLTPVLYKLRLSETYPASYDEYMSINSEAIRLNCEQLRLFGESIYVDVLTHILKSVYPDAVVDLRSVTKT